MAQIADTKSEVLDNEYIVRFYDNTSVTAPFFDNGKRVWKYRIGFSLNGESDIPFDVYGDFHDYDTKVKEGRTDSIFMTYTIFSDTLIFMQNPDYDESMDFLVYV